MNISKLLASTALVLTMATGVAVAAPITGSSSINFGIVTGLQGGGNALSMTGNLYAVPQSGDFTGTAGTGISNFSVTQTAFTPISFTSAIGNFTGLVTSVGIGGPFTNIVAQGTFTPLGALAGFDPNDMQFNLTFTFIQGGSVSGGGVINSEFVPVRIPEPMTLALFGLGLAGLGVAARRKA